MFETIEYETKGPLAWIRLNRPEKLNAVNALMVAELNQALDRAEADDSVRVIILSGNGRAFSAGFDLDDGGDEVELGEELKADFELILRFWHSPKVTLAAVHGYCLGSAMEMAVACDLTVTTDGCRFGAPEVGFGSGIVALVLPWFIGPKRAKELLLGGEQVSAQQAQSFGLVNQVVPEDELMQKAFSMAQAIAGNDPLAVRLTKQAINRSYEVMGMAEALAQALELDVLIESTQTDESREFNQILKAQGTRAAMAWRQAQADPDNKQEPV
jgi:enoyl-CoA hydratase